MPSAPSEAQRAAFVARLERRRSFVLRETADIAAARAHGVDVGLLVESYFATAEERLQRNDEVRAFGRAAVEVRGQTARAWLDARRARRAATAAGARPHGGSSGDGGTS